MAEDYILNVIDKTSKLDWAFPFQRTGAFPLDRSSLFSSYADAVLYASGGEDERGLSGSSYVGQPISVYDAKTTSVTLYVIQADRSLKEVGSVPIGDNLSIEVKDGIIQLKNFSKNYYAYVPAVKDEEGNITEASKYVLTEGFKAGLSLKAIQNAEGTFEIAWFEDSVEQNEKIENIKEELVGLNNKIGTPGDESNSSTGIYSELDKKADKINTYTKEETNLLVTTAINNSDHLKRKIVERTEDIDVNADDALRYIYMVPTGLELDDNKYYEYIVIETENTLDGKPIITRQIEKVGSWQVDLTSYATKEELNNQIAELESKKADKATTLAGYGITDTYTKTEITNLITDITGGESAASVLSQLNEYKTNNDNRVSTIEQNITNIDSDIANIKNGNYNYIKSVDENNFNVDVSGKLTINELQIAQIKNLNDTLNNKVDKIDGHRLISPAEISLLESLNNGDYDNFISAVNTSTFQVENGTLNLISIPKIALIGAIGDTSNLPNVDQNFTIVDEINYIYDRLTWKDMQENI